MEVDGQPHAPAALSPGKSWYLVYRGLGAPQERYGRVRKNSLQTGFDPLTVQLLPTELFRPIKLFESEFQYFSNKNFVSTVHTAVALARYRLLST
jgi:hypothetical protein